MLAFLYIIVIVALLLVVLNLMISGNYHVSRNIRIRKPVHEVFSYLKLLKNQSNWSPWEAKDPTMKKEYIGTDGTPGFISRWEGNKAVGSGEQEIIRIVEDDVMECRLRFLKPFKSQSDCYLKVVQLEPEATRVTWGFSGQNKFPVKLMMAFMNMDKMVGKDFEEGLSRLKDILENK